MEETAVRRWDVVGELSFEVKIVVHQSRMVGVLGRSCGGCEGVVSCSRRNVKRCLEDDLL
jgi:hypothetical protein